MTKDKKDKKKYETPVIVTLGELSMGIGAVCQDGSYAITGNCGNGDTAQPACKNGGTADASCNNGTTAGASCASGATAEPACSSGGNQS